MQNVICLILKNSLVGDMKTLGGFFFGILFATQSLIAAGTTPLVATPHEPQDFSDVSESLVGGQIYQHYNGKKYKILMVARHTDTLEESVVYQALYGNQDVWVRPLSAFLDYVMIDGKIQPHFVLVE